MTQCVLVMKSVPPICVSRVSVITTDSVPSVQTVLAEVVLVRKQKTTNTLLKYISHTARHFHLNYFV